MKILVYSINYAPELTGIGKYNGELVSWLSQRGHDVRVITAPPYYPQWRIDPPYAAWKYARHENVHRCPLWVPSSPGSLKRVLHLASFALSSTPTLLSLCLSWRPQVVFTLEPTLLCLPATLLCSRLCGARAWLHIQDYELDAAVGLGMVKEGLANRLGGHLERFLLKGFDVVSTISERMLAKMLDKGVEPKRAVLFPNWVNTEEIRPEPSQAMRRELGMNPQDMLVLYSGSMGRKQGLDTLVRAASMLTSHPRIRFLLCGEGPVLAELKAQAADSPNLQFLPLQPADRFPQLLNAADVHVLPQREDVQDLVFPSKLLAMFASGRPTVATVHPGSQIQAAVADCGLVTRPGDASELAGALETLADSPELRQRLGANARRWAVEKWGHQTLLSQFEKELLARC